MKFEVLGQPQGKGRPKVTIQGGFAHGYTPKKTANYETEIYYSYVAAKDRVFFKDTPVKMQITAFCQIPKAFSKKKHEEAVSGRLRPQTKPDIDNIVKVVCDALNGVAYHDDNQIAELISRKFYSDEPKLVIEITELD